MADIFGPDPSSPKNRVPRADTFRAEAGRSPDLWPAHRPGGAFSDAIQWHYAALKPNTVMAVVPDSNRFPFSFARCTRVQNHAPSGLTAMQYSTNLRMCQSQGTYCIIFFMFDQMRGGAALLSRRTRLIPAIAGAAVCKTLRRAYYGVNFTAYTSCTSAARRGTI